jgi:lipid-A-disaccharide synthase
MKKLRRWVDRVACVLPFEEEYFRGHGIDATFVGHPLFDELPTDRPAPATARFPERPPVIGLLPGSRRSEAQGNFPQLLDVAGRIARAFPSVSFLVPTTPATHPLVSHDVAAASIRLEIGEGKFDEMVPRCDLCITVSGTATLHVAGYGVPMIVVYRGSPVLWHLIGRWIIRTRTYSLVNLLADRHEHIVPEFIPWYGSNEPVAQMAIDCLRHPEKLAGQREKLKRLVGALDRPGASMNAARLAMEMMVKGEA